MAVKASRKKSESGDAATNKVNAILAAAPKEHRLALQRIRKTIQGAVPEAAEAISYGIPAFKYKGKPLVGYASFKDHCTYFPMSGSVTSDLKKELVAFKTSKGGINFQPGNPLSETLIRKLLRARINEIEKG